MSLPRPPSRTAWWLAFIFIALPFPFLFVAVSLTAFGNAGPYIFVLALFAAPLVGCYLLGISRLPLPAKLALIPIFYCAVVFALLPRPMCGDEEASGNNQAVPNISAKESHGCSS